MLALCLHCGVHHEVVRVLEGDQGEAGRDVYQVAALPTCEHTWLSETDLLEARARFGQEALVQDPDEEIL